jgi:hypothetical protein
MVPRYGARRWWATRTQPLRAGLVSGAAPSLESTTNLKVSHNKSKHKVATYANSLIPEGMSYRIED